MTSNIKRVAFIGLGAMGYPMAGHLQQAGFDTCVYNRTADKATQWVTDYGGVNAETPALAALNADVVCICVGNDDDVRSVIYGDNGILTTMKPGGVVIDHTTASAELARELDQTCTEHNLCFLDAPVSGGQAGAENGALTIMIGGAEPVYERIMPLLNCYAKSTRLMGESGAGQLTKMANQICIAGLVQGLSEALHFADKAGLDGRAVIAAISKGAAQSWQMENRHATMIDGQFDFGFAVDWMRKDLGIVIQAANDVGASLPVTALVDQFYADIQHMGGGRWDTSSLIERLRRLNGSYRMNSPPE